MWLWHDCGNFVRFEGQNEHVMNSGARTWPAPGQKAHESKMRATPQLKPRPNTGNLIPLYSQPRNRTG